MPPNQPTRPPFTPEPAKFPWTAWIPYLLVVTLAGGFYFAKEHYIGAVQTGILKLGDGAKSLGLDLENKGGKRGAQRPWSSLRPLLIDVDADGRNELLSIIQDGFGGKYMIQCMNNTDWSDRWTIELGPNKTALGTPQLRWLPDHKLLIAALGNQIWALDPSNGQERWAAKISDKVERMGFAQGTLWIQAADEHKFAISAKDGKLLAPETKWPTTWKLLASDQDQDLMPSGPKFEDSSPKVEEVSFEDTYCPASSVVVEQRDERASGRCTDPRGLAYVTRKKGTEFPYILNFDRKAKEGRWMTQLSDPEGMEVLKTFDSPFLTFSYPHDKAVAVFAAYRIDDDPHVRLARISMEDGEMEWLNSYSTTKRTWIHSISTDEHYLYMRVDNALIVLTPEDGELVKQLGYLRLKD